MFLIVFISFKLEGICQLSIVPNHWGVFVIYINFCFFALVVILSFLKWTLRTSSDNKRDISLALPQSYQYSWHWEPFFVKELLHKRKPKL